MVSRFRSMDGKNSISLSHLMLGVFIVLALTLSPLRAMAQDSDGDEMPDAWELAHPCMNPVVSDWAQDYDGDYASNYTEYTWGTDPCMAEDTDSDAMTDGWERQYACVNYQTDDSAQDPDSDNLTNLQEFQAHTNPCNSDTDGDLMPDGWEAAHPCMDPTANDAGQDYDHDFSTNLDEYQQGTDPCGQSDSDSDGMPDWWEQQYGCLNYQVDDAALDPDYDTLTSLQEYQAGTDPCVANDSDGDGMPDWWEAAHPCMSAMVPDAGLDYDSDLWTNLYEYQHGTDPCIAEDTDSDGMPDGYEQQHACLDYQIDDAAADPDSDTLANLQEYQAGTDPCAAPDTDGDGMPDVWENAHSCMNPDLADAGLDYDTDIWTNLYEYLHGTDPCLAEDSDSDGMPDGYEQQHACLDYQVDDAAQDPDDDTLTNLQEYQAGTEPCDVNDGDGDGMPDWWELAHPCMNAAASDAGQDYDSDLWTNLYEYQNGTDPCNAEDSDSDGMPDGYEQQNACLDYQVDDAALDADGDNLTNLQEYLAGTEPCAVYVSQTTGSDATGDGSQAHPFASIGKGTGVAGPSGSVMVAAGIYPEHLTISSDFNLMGGYDPLTWARAPAVFRSIIDGGGTGNVIYVDTDYPALISVTIDGFVIRNGSYGISTNTGTTTIRNNIIMNNGTGIYALAPMFDWYPYESAVGVALGYNLIIANATGVRGEGGSMLIYEFTYEYCEIGNLSFSSSHDTIASNTSRGVIITTWGYDYLECPSPTITSNISHSIIYGNPSNLSLFDADGVTFSDVGGGWAGTGNINTDPLFWDSTEMDHLLKPASPCIIGSTAVMGFSSSGSPWADADFDGAPNSWETHWGFDPGNPYDGWWDCDFDGVINRREYYQGTDPGFCGDMDGDGMPDGYEQQHACLDYLVSDGAADPDGDGVTNLEEMHWGFDPCVSDDSDGDGMLDGWEVAHACMNPIVPDAEQDYDSDYRTNLYEYQHGTDPCVAEDTDADGMIDGYEQLHACLDYLADDSAADPDNDGLTNLQEYQVQTDPCFEDTDGDGMDDGWEVNNTCMDPLASISTPVVAGAYDTPGRALKVYHSGNYAYVADYDSGLQIVNVSDPSTPALAGTCDTPGIAMDVYVSGNYAYVADNTYGLQIINVSNPAAPFIAVGCDTPQLAQGVYFSGGYAYVADGASGLQIIDANPYSPFIAGTYDTPGAARSVYVSGDYAYVADDTSGLQIINVSNPSGPTLAATFSAAGKSFDVYVSGGYAYVANDNTGLLIIDISNPAAPALAGSYYAPVVGPGTMDIHVSGGYAYLAEISSLLIIDVSNPTAPSLTATVTGTADGVYASGSYAYIAAYNSGLEILSLEDADLDYLPDLDEYNAGLDPCNPDSDGDGAKDGVDCDSFDPYNWDACATCHDYDADSWYELCDRYVVDDVVPVGSLTWTWYWPFDGHPDARTQSIYLASEIGRGGTITSLSLYVSTVPGRTLSNFTIRMKHTTLASYPPDSWEGPGSGWTTVYQHDEPQGVTGWRTYALDTPFVYNGQDNLMVDFSFNNLSGLGPSGVVYSSMTSANRSLMYGANNDYGDPLDWSGTANPTPTAYNRIPNLRFSFFVSSINGPDCDDGNSVIHPGAPELCDGIDNQCPGDPGYGEVDEGCGVTDSDGDGLTDADEINIYGTDPYNPDTDGDGLTDGQEVGLGTLPLSWDSDGDYIPDDYEVANMSGATPLDPLNAADGAEDFDGDGNSNVNEYWNGTDPWIKDPVPDPFYPVSPGCYYWGEGDGDGYVLANDKSILLSEVLGMPQPYDNVLPRGVADDQDMDADGYILAGDLSILKSFIVSSLVGGVGSRAAALEKVYEPISPVAVGGTAHVTVRVRNSNVANNLYQAGFSVVFSIDPSSTGSAVLLGGDGSYGAGTRFSVSGPSGASDGGHATMHLKVTSPGTIIVNATIPACGMSGTGRWMDQVTLDPAFTITAE